MDEKLEHSLVKVSEPIKARIKLGSAALKTTMGEVIADAVNDYLGQGEDMLNANQTAINAGEPIPYPRDVFAQEIVRRRSSS